MRQKTDSLDKLIAFLKKKLLILKNIKKREMVTPDSLVKRCVSKLCKRALMVSSDILEKNKINTNIDTLTVKQLSKIRLSELQKLRSIKPLHLRELKETVREAGLEFKK